MLGYSYFWLGPPHLKSSDTSAVVSRIAVGENSTRQKKNSRFAGRRAEDRRVAATAVSRRTVVNSREPGQRRRRAAAAVVIGNRTVARGGRVWWLSDVVGGVSRNKRVVRGGRLKATAL
ncbi:double-stranded RNA-binding protein staufen homolog 2 [Striga asiatica]|uniref:Double-stranded RNA-binding protein staufen homolog 2 n=1 Tax=Striga asiatica TaxID=4170 RepID=A0A5A7QBS8_STRAF|nr:double-stranded RNA-binding protein staufen homolog 2 [Striga asiatica]